MNTTCSWISFVSRFLLLLVLMGCRPNPVIRPDAAQIQQSELLPRLFPDYRDIALPVNIAPLNFRVDEPVDAVYLQISSSEGDVLELSGTDKLLFESTAWKQLLRTHAGQTLTCRLYGRTQNQWLQWPAFNWSIKSDSIDPYLVYRLIEPGYEKWHKVGIYQRNLENFDEEVLVRNDMTGYNCINCHTFNQGNSDQMLLHMRGEHGGTYLTHNQEIQKLNTKTDQTLSHFSYSYWHPSGRYIAASLNKTWQFFHATTPHKMEVYDDASDVVVYDVETQTIRADASLISEEAYETFPMFSPDGTWLYYCVAPALPMPDSYNELRYSLCRVPFDEQTGTIGTTVDTLFAATEKSCAFPRISPDGRWLMYTETDYGQFPIWHKGAELALLDLTTGQSVDFSGANSPDTESYHSWGSNSRWFVFSSRRHDGLYTLPYLCYLNDDGMPSKPFLLPQKEPQAYDYQLCSYNLPELVRSRVSLDPYALQHAAQTKQPQAISFR